MLTNSPLRKFGVPVDEDRWVFDLGGLRGWYGGLVREPLILRVPEGTRLMGGGVYAGGKLDIRVDMKVQEIDGGKCSEDA